MTAKADSQVTVDYWFVNFSRPFFSVEDLFALLDQSEKARALRFKFEQDRKRFIIARGVLRQILGDYLHQEPQAISFHYGKYGKPAVEDVAFNLSHGQNLGLYGIIRDVSSLKIGVDIEEGGRSLDPLSLAERFFTASEYQLLQQSSPEEQSHRFLQLWTAKEAYLKALGVGLQGGLDRVAVTFQPQPQLLVPDATVWSLRMLHPAEHEWGAIAVNYPQCEFVEQGEWMI